MDHPQDLIAPALKRARAAAGWSQRDLAERAGVHQPQVARAERGDDMQASVLARIALPLGLAPALVPCGAAQAHDGGRPDAGAEADVVEAGAESWREAWPQVDPQVFMVLAPLTRAGPHVE